MNVFEEFMVCPNCKRPIFRREALEQGVPVNGTYCGYCGSEISSTIKKALEIAKPATSAQEQSDEPQ